MKKALGVLSVLVLITVMLVSCNAEQKVNDTIKVSFNVSSSRALTVENQNFEPVNSGDLTWYYHGEKKTDTEFKTGQSASMNKTSTDYWTRISTGDKLSATSKEFSQGQWYFEVKAIKNAGTDNATQMYYGKTNGNVLLTKGNNTISISVSPFVSGVKGTLKIDSVYIDPKDAGSENVAPNKLLINGIEKTFTKSADSKSISFTELVEPGTYTVEVKRIGTDTGIVLASASKTVVVYSGLTTTIKGSVEEDTTTGTFVPQPIKPEGTETVTVPTTGDAVVKFVNVTPSMKADKSTTVTIPSAVVPSTSNQVTLDIVVKDSESVADSSFKVDTADKGVAASISLTMKNGETPITNFGSNKVTVETYIETGLSGVTVKYNETTGDPDAADTTYDPNTGKLIFKTTHFSEFYVVAVAQAKIDNVGYCLLQTAFNVAENNSTISLLADVETPKTSYYVENKNLTLNLDGHKLSGSGYDGTLCVKSNATLTINGDGEVIGNDDNNYGMAIWAVGENAKVIINGGTYSNTLTHDDDQMDLIYASRGGNVVINGGEFECVTPAWTLNVKDQDYVGCGGASNITVCGGKFHGFNPANCESEGIGTSFVVDWYSSKKSGTESEAIYKVDSAVDDEEITISSVEGLKEFARLVNNDGHSFKGQTIKLVRDIDLNNEKWTPIGYSSRRNTDGPIFKGTFDGQNHSVTKITYNETNANMPSGFFGTVEGATISNLIIGGTKQGDGYDYDGESKFTHTLDSAAGIVDFVIGKGETKIEKCINVASIDALEPAGIVGRAYNSTGSTTINGCKNYGTINGKENEKAGGTKTGGILGINQSNNDTTVSNCENHGIITGNNSNVGGIVGLMNVGCKITNCNNYGKVENTGNNNYYAGGIVGYIQSNNSGTAKIENCTNSGEIKSSSHAGGIGGRIDMVATVINCNNTGEVTASTSGGIAGVLQGGKLENCSNSASINGTNISGGVVGNWSYNIGSAGYIKNCNGGSENVISTGSSKGRLIGTLATNYNSNPHAYLVINDNNNDDYTNINTIGSMTDGTQSVSLEITSGTLYGLPILPSGNHSSHTLIFKAGSKLSTGSSSESREFTVDTQFTSQIVGGGWQWIDPDTITN